MQVLHKMTYIKSRRLVGN